METLDAGGGTVPGSEVKYWPYGAMRQTGAPGTDQLFTGQRREPDTEPASNPNGIGSIGLYNYKARFYSTTIGRFATAVSWLMCFIVLAAPGRDCSHPNLAP